MIEEGQTVSLKAGIPDRWDYALDKFKRSKVLPEYLGADFCRTFEKHRRTESRQYHNIISPLDYDWYMRSV